MIQRYEKQAFSGFTTKNCSLILKNKGDDSMRILVAEDEKDLNRIIVERLEQEHYRLWMPVLTEKRRWIIWHVPSMMR